MGQRALRARRHHPLANQVRAVRQPNRNHLDVAITEVLAHGAQRCHQIWRHPGLRVVRVVPDAQWSLAPGGRFRPGQWFAQRGGIVGVMAGQNLQHACRVHHAARHRPDVIQRVGQGEYAMPADPAVARLDAHHAAGGGREADTAAGIRADGAGHQSCRQRHTRSARRHSGPVGLVPGIAWRLDIRMMGRERAFCQLDLADHHRARITQAPGDGRVVLRHEVAQHPGAASGPHAAREHQVLERHRDAKQRAARGGIPLPRRIELHGAFNGLIGQYGHEGPVHAVSGGDAIQRSPGDFTNADLTGGDLRVQRDDAQIRQVQGSSPG